MTARPSDSEVLATLLVAAESGAMPIPGDRWDAVRALQAAIAALEATPVTMVTWECGPPCNHVETDPGPVRCPKCGGYGWTMRITQRREQAAARRIAKGNESAIVKPGISTSIGDPW